jgi:6-phosphogluconolactonase
MEFLFESREAATTAAANRLADALLRRLNGNGNASLVVSGGTSPAKCLEELSSAPLDWQRVHILLSDERWVPVDDPNSNENMVRRTLLQNCAAHAHLLPIYDGSTDVLSRCQALEVEIRAIPIPFAAALIGMGEDGHFASLFPDFDQLKSGLDVDFSGLCMPVSTAASAHARISLTLAAISRSDEVVLLIFGDAKRGVYEQAKLDSNGFPVSRLLRQKRAPVHVYWAP